jgi:hypothetical protein
MGDRAAPSCSPSTGAAKVTPLTREGQVAAFVAAADRLVALRDDLKGPASSTR